MTYRQETIELVDKISRLSVLEKKSSGFLIGNTAKQDALGVYLTPIRSSRSMVTGGIVVYSETQAMEVATLVDGKVTYILVDTEKKVADQYSRHGEPANIERAVREVVKKSKLWVYKGNDLSVEAIDAFLGYRFKDSVRGLGGKRVTIIGAGNLGSKIALKLVERASTVTITRRDSKQLRLISDAINVIKPKYTLEKIRYTTDNNEAARDAEILIGATDGRAVITEEIVGNISADAVIIDVGKGTLTDGAIKVASERDLDIFRLDITAALSGLTETLQTVEEMVEKRMGRRDALGHRIVAGGLMGRRGEIVVDNITHPNVVYGIADGTGDFIRQKTDEEEEILRHARKVFETNG